MANHRKRGDRFPNGKLKPQLREEIAPFNQEDVVRKEERDGKKLVVTYNHVGSTVLGRLHHRQFINNLELVSGEHFGTIWGYYRSHYLGGAKPFPKVSKPERGYPGSFDFDDDGDPCRWVKLYSSAITELRRQHDGDALAGVARSVCLFDIECPQANLFRLKRSLQVLARHFGFARWL